MVEFVDLDAINNTLQIYEQTLKDEQPTQPEHILVFMVRGLFVKFQFPYAQYCTTANILFPLVWDVIRYLEVAGLKVISLRGHVIQCFFAYTGK